MHRLCYCIQFENDVKTYGTQTNTDSQPLFYQFENDVKTYGTQTRSVEHCCSPRFENDVKTYGTQTIFVMIKKCYPRLRMMYNLIS